MAFEPNKILSGHIISAVKKIEDEKLKLIPSTGYDAIINGKRYPPKEIIRISHQIAVGTAPGIIYGGEPVNRVLRNLGFEVVQKISIWKLGCNWGSGAPSFYEFIKKESIVIGTESFNYREGDLVLITEGFTVYAIAKIVESPTKITDEKKYQEPCDDYEIDYNSSITYAKAEWYELPKTEIFIYQLQSGIRKVHKQDVIEKTINIWENREFQLSNISFYIKLYNQSVSDGWLYPCFVLTKHNWDDYGYKTSYELIYYKSVEDKVEIGSVKILNIDDKHTTTSPIFSFLDPSKFGSLGMTLNYYKRLKAEFPETYLQILKALNDCAFFEEAKKTFESHEGFRVSLLRSTEAELLLQEAKDLLNNSPKFRKYNFKFEYKIPGADIAHLVPFSFNENDIISNRIFCIVGKNGTGKTKIISQLANKLTNNKEDGDFFPERPEFSKIITASFSCFDKFKFPEKLDASYEFIGIRTPNGSLDEPEMSNELWKAFKTLSIDKEKKAFWTTSIKSSMESEYLSFNLNEIESLSTRNDFIETTEDIFSSGQKIVFHFITRLLAVIEDNSILIFDEPETHLHPNIAGRLLKTIKNILKEFNSFYILSTHSPIIVQEIPSRYIIVFDRQENYPLIYNPTIECFGENLSNISNSIFRANEEKES
jgi:predicted ATPase